MKGNKILYAGIAILILGIGFAVGTYAYYQTTVTGTVGGTVLAWECKAGEAGTTLSTSSFTIGLGDLYPGTSGYKTIEVNSGNMPADFTITFSNFVNMGSGSTHPYLNIYSTSAHATSDRIGNSGTINGETTLDNVTGKYKGTATFYYWWPYGANGDGTQGVEDYDPNAPSVRATITCSQK